MTDPISQTFSTIRATLQRHDVTWQQLLDTLTATYNKLDGAQRDEFRARYVSYVEEEVDARLEDWQRTISLDDYMLHTSSLHVALSRHLEVKYNRDTFIKSYLTRCDRHFSQHPLDQFTALSLHEIGERNALHLVKLFTAHRPARLTEFAFSRERFMRTTSRSTHAEVFDALLSLPDPDTLRTLTLIWNVALRETSERDLYDALCTHLPRYTALTTFTLAEEFRTSTHLAGLRASLPHTVTHLSLHAEHVPDMTSFLAHDLFARLQTLRLSGLTRDVAKKILDDQRMLHLSHMDLAWDFRIQPWRTTRNKEDIKVHDLTKVAHDDTLHTLPQAQLNAESLSLGNEEPITFAAFHAMLCQTSDEPRIFPFLKSLTLFGLDLDSFKLLMTRGAPCFPKLTSLSINFDVPPVPLDITWRDAPIWHGITYLRLVTGKPELGRALDSFWAHDSSHSIFPDVTEFELNNMDLDTYALAIPVLTERFPKLRTLGRFSTGYRGETLTASIFELMREHRLFDALHSLRFSLYERIGLYTSTEQIAYWISLLTDEEIPAHLRRYIFHQLVAHPTKDDLLDYIAPAMGVTLPKSLSKQALTARLAASLPPALRDYNAHPEFAQRSPSPIVLHKP